MAQYTAPVDVQEAAKQKLADYLKVRKGKITYQISDQSENREQVTEHLFYYSPGWGRPDELWAVPDGPGTPYKL